MLGIIGGSGLYSLDIFQDPKIHKIDTPFGETSAPILEFEYQNSKVFFLPRHGEKHQYLPHEINYRANIYALKKLRVKALIAISAVGSLRQEHAPGEIVIANQFVDFTKNRINSFFGEGLVAHVSTANPTCELLESFVISSAKKIDINLDNKLTYLVVEGPRFGTRAESLMFQNCGADLVGMTNAPEVFLACEAQIAYASLCLITDYDCWKEGEKVSVASMLELYGKNIEKIKTLIPILVKDYNPTVIAKSSSRTLLENAILSDQNKLSVDQKELLLCLLS